MNSKIKEYYRILIEEPYFRNGMRRKYELDLPVEKEILDKISNELDSSLTWNHVLFTRCNDLFCQVDIYELNTFIGEYDNLSLVDKKKIDFLLNEYEICIAMEDYSKVIILENTTIISIVHDIIVPQKFIFKLSNEFIIQILEYYGFCEYKQDVFIYNPKL